MKWQDDRHLQQYDIHHHEDKLMTSLIIVWQFDLWRPLCLVDWVDCVGQTLVLDMNLEQYSWWSVLTSKVDTLEQKSVAAVLMRLMSRLLWLNVQMYTDLDDDMPCALWWSIPYDDVKDLVGDLMLRQTLMMMMHADWHNCWWCWQAAEKTDMMCMMLAAIWWTVWCIHGYG